MSEEGDDPYNFDMSKKRKKDKKSKKKKSKKKEKKEKKQPKRPKRELKGGSRPRYKYKPTQNRTGVGSNANENSNTANIARSDDKVVELKVDDKVATFEDQYGLHWTNGTVIKVNEKTRTIKKHIRNNLKHQAMFETNQENS